MWIMRLYRNACNWSSSEGIDWEVIWVFSFSINWCCLNWSKASATDASNGWWTQNDILHIIIKASRFELKSGSMKFITTSNGLIACWLFIYGRSILSTQKYKVTLQMLKLWMIQLQWGWELKADHDHSEDPESCWCYIRLTHYHRKISLRKKVSSIVIGSDFSPEKQEVSDSFKYRNRCLINTN